MSSRAKRSPTGAQIWATLTPSQQRDLINAAINQGLPLQGAGFFSFVKKAAKKVAPVVKGAVKVAAPIAIGIATRAIERKIAGKGVYLAGRGRKPQPRSAKTGRFVKR